jgi:HEAT repeat protein
MALYWTRKPNVKALARRGDVDALVAAAGYQDLIPAPDRGTADRGAAVRQEAILALGGLGPDVGAEAVTAALSDNSDRVRLAAIQVLYGRQEAAPLAAAMAWLPTDRGHARRLAMRALAELRRPDSAPALTAALVHAHGDGPVSDDDALLLTLLLKADEGSAAAGGVVEQLLTALADERDTISERAEELLALLAPVSIEGVIAELMAGAAPHRAAAVLARIKDTRALEPLLAALVHRDARVRAGSATALGELRDPAAVEALIQATRDSDHDVRARAGTALDQLGMVALVVGVSTLVRPMILEAVAGVESRPALPGPEHATEATNVTTPDQATGAAIEATSSKPQTKVTNGAAPDQPTETAKGAAPDQPTEAANGAEPDQSRQPATADLLERLFAGRDDLADVDERRS